MECLDPDTVLELVGGQLTRARAAEIAAHIDDCDTCRELVAEAAASLSPRTVEDPPPAMAATAVAPPPRSSWPALARDPDQLPIVETGVYLRLDEVARGGLGRIVRARDLRTDRMVAIKEMLGDARDAAARFVREALVTANLQHPAIVPVYEVGRWPDGQPFYAMKLVTGQPLNKVIEGCRDLDARLALIPHVIAIADALAYAHGEGVIHRDLKPHNVLVGAHGETVVIDWGLARRIGARDDVTSASSGDGEHTVVGSVLGTPAYMAPEQARGERVDEHADVYAIGAILYRALAGRTPYTAESSEELLANVRRGPPPPLAELAPEAPRDLVAIVERAMAREPSERYPSASELVIDLRLFTTGQLVRAHRYTALQRARRFVARYRASIAVAAIAVIALAVVGVAALVNIIAARDRADEQRDEAHRRLVAAYVDRARVELVAEHADRALAFAAAAADLGATGADVQFVAARALDALPELHRFAASSVAGIAFVPGTQDLVIASADGLARWRGERSELQWRLDGASSDLAMLGPRELAVRRGGDVVIVGTEDGRVVATLAAGAAIRGAVVIDDARHWLAAATADRGYVLYDLATRTRVAASAPADLDAIALIAPDGQHVVARRGTGLAASLVVVDRAGSVAPLCAECWIARAAGSQLVWIGTGGEGHGQRLVVADWTGATVREIPLSPDGLAANLVVDAERGLAVVANSNGTLGLYVLAIGLFRGTRAVHDVPHAMLFDGTDRVWVLGLYNGLTAFDLKHGLELGRWRTGGEWLARSDDDAVLATGGAAGASWWRVRASPVELVQPTQGRVVATAFADDGALLTGSDDGAIGERDTAGHVRVIASHTSVIDTLEPLAPGSVLAASHDETVLVWDRASGREQMRLTAAGAHAAASPDGTRIATGDHKGRVALWDRASGRALATLAMPRAIAAIRWTPDGARFGAIDRSGALRIWDRDAVLIFELDAVGSADTTRPDAATVANVFEALERADAAYDIAFSPDGHWLARACPGCPALYDAASSRAIPLANAELREPVLALAFSHDSSRLVLATGGTVRIWDTATGALRSSIATNTRTLAARFSPDDRFLYTGGMDNRVRVWDVETGSEYTHFDPRTPIASIAVSRDGTRVAATTGNALMLWTLAPLAPLAGPASLRMIAACRTGVTFDAGMLVEAPPICAP